jgi:hypothetical protein
MSKNEWKEGFEAGLDFVLTFVNEQCNTKFEGIGALAGELQYLQLIKSVLQDRVTTKEQS